MTTSFRASFIRAVIGAAACLTAIAGATTQARTQETPAVQLGQTAQRTFNIPSQPLEPALLLFGRQSGRQVAANGDILAGLSSPGVQGTMSVEEALRRLLSGTGLTYTGTGGGTISIHRPGQGAGALPPGVQQLDPVQVQGYPVPSQAMIDNLPPPYAGGQVATGGQLGLLGNRSVMNTPFNQTNYTSEKAQNQQAQTIRDVLIDDPSVRAQVADGGHGADFMYIRGFPVSTASALYGGLQGMLPTFSIMAELPERIELLKGPSAMLYGMSALTTIGGTVNIVPKRAPSEPLTQLTANYVSDAQFGAHADIGRRFGSDNQIGVRFNGAFRAGQTPVQGNSDQRALALLGLDFRGERIRLSADLGYQYQYIGGVIPYLGPDNGIPLPWAPNARKNFGQPWNYQERKDLFGVFRGEVDITERITAYASFGAHDLRQNYLSVSDLTITSFSGNAVGLPVSENFYSTYVTAEAGLRGFVDTGPVGHEFAFSATTFDQTNGTGFGLGDPLTTNIYSPTIIARPNIVNSPAGQISTNKLTGFALADTLSVADKRIQLTLGGRLQRVLAANFDPATGQQLTGYDQSALSPSVALIVKPWQGVSFYGNWIQGLQQGIIIPTFFSNGGEVLPPYLSTQYELGVKIDWGKFTTTASVFQISQPSLITDVAVNALTLGGEQRNQGLELNFFGEPTEGVRLLGGLMLLNGVLTKTQGGLTDGWIAPFAPPVNLNLGGEWDLPFAPGLTLNGRAVYTSSQYIDTTWPRRSLPAWTRFDLGARYTFDNARSPTGKPVAIRFNVENVLDANYWASGGGPTSLNLGAPRTLRLSLTSDF